MKYQQWNIAQRSQEAYKAMERQGVPTLVAATLCARGMTDLAEAKGLLSSGEDQLQDPFLMKDMDLATARIGRALRNGEKIAVYGDYDVDGITSTCLLTHYLRAQGGDVCYYIPNRLSEGYGVNREAVEELARQGVRLMITVDCGITAVEEVAYASGLGIDVIITDHHECKEEIPAAVWRDLANRDGEVVEVPASLARKVAQEGDLWESTLHTMICLEVLESFDLVTLRPEEGGALRIRLQKRRGKGKVALYQAPIIQKLQAIAWGEERRSHLSS